MIFVGGNAEACRRMGFRRADTMRDALEMAEQVVGRDPSLTHFHCPPRLLRPSGKHEVRAGRTATGEARRRLQQKAGSPRAVRAPQVAHAHRRARTHGPTAVSRTRPGCASRCPAAAARDRPADVAVPGHARGLEMPTIIGAEDLVPRAPARDPRAQPRERHRHAARPARAAARLALAHRGRRRVRDRFYRKRGFAIAACFWINTFPFDRGGGQRRGLAAALRRTYARVAT